MMHPTRIATGLAGIVLCISGAPGADEPASAAAIAQTQNVQRFLQTHPRVALSERAERIRRVYGAAFSNGATALESAEAFRLQHSRMFGVLADELVGARLQPIMYLQDTGTYKFTGVFYTQQKHGIPVFRSQLKVIVRNEGGSPAVLASADLRDLTDFRVAAGAAEAPVNAVGEQAALAWASQLSELDDEAFVVSTRRVIWAGVDDMIVKPRLADELYVNVGVDEWLVLTDTQTGVILYDERQICEIDISGIVEGVAGEGIGADICDTEIPLGLPHVVVTAGADSGVTDADGNYVISHGGASPIDVGASLVGLWFEVFNAAGAETSETVNITPPGPADLLFNAANSGEIVRAEVNAYLHANRLRDRVLVFNPGYPTLGNSRVPGDGQPDGWALPRQRLVLAG